MELNVSFLSRNSEETLTLARKLACENLPPGSIFLLKGEVGSGKTTFVRGFVSSWDLDSLVTSPTFTLMNEYSNDKIRICHFDFYRLNSMEEILELGIEDYLTSFDYSFIEWPDIGEPLFNFDAIRIDFKMGANENERMILVKSQAGLYKR